MLKLAIIAGSTRPGRNGGPLTHWAREVARRRKAAEFELVDPKDYPLPLLDKPLAPITPL